MCTSFDWPVPHKLKSLKENTKCSENGISQFLLKEVQWNVNFKSDSQHDSNRKMSFEHGELINGKQSHLGKLMESKPLNGITRS